MGPSILAAAFTTAAAASVMLFCVVTFFYKFAIILLTTIIQATLGSFIVFISLADAVGPAEPTWLMDTIIAKVRGNRSSEEDEDDDIKNVKSMETTTSEPVGFGSSF